MRSILKHIQRSLVRLFKNALREELIIPSQIEIRDQIKSDSLVNYNEIVRLVNINQENINHVRELLDISIDVVKLPKATGVQRLFQYSQLLLISRFEKLCKKLEINYWLDFGTLLGAVRHKGFIPWDDDLDVGMMIGDYKKLCEVNDKELSQFNLFSPKKFTGTFKKLVLEELKEDTILGIDIFPYYYESKHSKAAPSLLSRINECIDEINRNEVTNEAIEKLSKKYEINQSVRKVSQEDQIIYLGTSCILYNQILFEPEDFFPLNKLQFEDRQLPVPRNYYKLLFSRYGNFFELPKNLTIDKNRHSNAINLKDPKLIGKLIHLASIVSFIKD